MILTFSEFTEQIRNKLSLKKMQKNKAYQLR
nr:MAG TPA: hypothetical protein [Caudoviricetes sp.]